MWIRVILVILCLSIFACGDYAALEAIDKNKHVADSLYRVQKDSLSTLLDGVCDSIYNIHYERAVDSIKTLRLESIEALIGQ